MARIAAFLALLGVGGVLGAYLFNQKDAPTVNPEDPILGGGITAKSENFRHLETEGGKDKYLLTAATDNAYANGAHELNKVELVSFGGAGERRDKIVSETCVYDPTKAVAVFKTGVVVDTTDGLHLEAEELRYHQETGVVQIAGPAKYTRANLEGTCRDAVLETNEERIQMLHDVDMTLHSSDEKAPAEGGPAAAPAAAAPEKKHKKGGKGGGKKGKGGGGGGKKKRAAKAAAAGGGSGTAAVDFSSGPRIPVRIRSASADFDKKALLAHYTGGVLVERGADEMRAADMVGHLTAENRIEKIEARGNAYLKASGRAQANAPSMDFFFAEGNQLQRALATGGATLDWLGEPPARDVKGERIDIEMAPGETGSELHTARAEGQAVVTMAAPAPTDAQPNPAARELRGDTVTTEMQPGGRFARTVDANGNAVLTITPIKAVAEADRKRIAAGHMLMTFHEGTELAREFTGDGGVKVDLEPLVSGGRATRTTTSDTARADFDRESQDVSVVEQTGNFKYIEGERNGTADRATYTRASDLVAMRGGRPTVWDSKARTQADEIDIHSIAGTNQARGDVRTTYYSPGATGGSVPFGNAKSPVFLTGAQLDTRQSDGGVAVYTGGSRAWQDDNYVKADTIRLFDASRRMEAEGRVESGLYQTKRKDEAGKTEPVPVFTTAERMRYTDAERLIHYDGSVVSRQTPDELTSESQDVWLTTGERAEVDRLVAEGSVVMTEPGRKGTGSKLVYTASDQKAVLTGSNARVEDAAQGTSTGAELTYYVGGDRVRSVGGGAGRVKSTHRVGGKEAH